MMILSGFAADVIEDTPWPRSGSARSRHLFNLPLVAAVVELSPLAQDAVVTGISPW